MAQLTTETVHRLMNRFRARFNLPDKLLKDASLWEATLREGGLQEDDAVRFYEGFVSNWTDNRKPSLHDVLKALKRGAYGAREARAYRRLPSAGKCGWCDDSGGFPVVAPAVLLHTTMSLEELRYVPGQKWAHAGPGNSKSLEAWSVVCKCSVGQRMASSLSFRYSDTAQSEALRELHIPWFKDAATGEWWLEPGRQMGAWAACQRYLRRTRHQDWEPSLAREAPPIGPVDRTDRFKRLKGHLRSVQGAWGAGDPNTPAGGDNVPERAHTPPVGAPAAPEPVQHHLPPVADVSEDEVSF